MTSSPSPAPGGGTLKAIDLFAGLGGWTAGAEAAGIRVVWAANHWPAAVAAHAENHAHTQHVCQDLHQADWSKVPAHDLLLASPCCQGHARARGKDRPQHDASRSTAWAVVSAAEYHRPRLVAIENVPEFRNWSLYPAWRDAMNRLGYTLTENIIDAADCGAPQNRVRLVIVASLGKAIELRTPSRAHVAVETILDFKAGAWSHIDKPGRATSTLDRWRNGRREYGDRFVFSFYGNTKSGRSLARPVGTITTRDRWAIVDGDRMRMFSVDEARAAMSFDAGYRLPTNKRLAMHLLGNAVPPAMAREVCSQILEARHV